MIKKLPLLICCLVTLTFQIHGQAPQFSQVNSNPLYLNPALCGENKGSRYMLNFRNQWAAVSGGYRTFALGVDHHSNALRSGLGMSLCRDVAGINRLAFTNLSIYFSHKVKISKKQGIKAGIRFSHVIRSVDTSRMLFADQVIRDNAEASIEPNVLERMNYQEIGIGLLYHDENWWTGLSMANINRPNTSLMVGGEIPLPIKYSLHGGILLYKKKGRKPEATKLLYEYKTAQKWDQLDLGIHYKYHEFIMGLSYRGLPFKSYQPGYSNHDAMILLIGMEMKDGWKFGYSYDMTISRLTVRSGGTHEISVTFEKPQKIKRKRIVVPPCMAW